MKPSALMMSGIFAWRLKWPSVSLKDAVMHIVAALMIPLTSVLYAVQTVGAAVHCGTGCSYGQCTTLCMNVPDRRPSFHAPAPVLHPAPVAPRGRTVVRTPPIQSTPAVSPPPPSVGSSPTQPPSAAIRPGFSPPPNSPVSHPVEYHPLSPPPTLSIGAMPHPPPTPMAVSKQMSGPQAPSSVGPMPHPAPAPMEKGLAGVRPPTPAGAMSHPPPTLNPTPLQAGGSMQPGHFYQRAIAGGIEGCRRSLAANLLGLNWPVLNGSPWVSEAVMQPRLGAGRLGV